MTIRRVVRRCPRLEAMTTRHPTGRCKYCNDAHMVRGEPCTCALDVYERWSEGDLTLDHECTYCEDLEEG